VLPFDAHEFFEVFARNNAAVWPAPIALELAALVAVILALRPGGGSDRAIGVILGGLWLWMGGVYHLGFFRPINPAATVFGVLFVLEGVGAALIVYALVIYPILARSCCCRGRRKYGPQRAQDHRRVESSDPDPLRSIVDQLVSRGPKVENEVGNSQLVRAALGHEDPNHLFLRVDVPGRAEGAVPTEASGHVRKIVAAGHYRQTETPAASIPKILEER
jgi:hypothetical protein